MRMKIMATKLGAPMNVPVEIALQVSQIHQGLR
jgi:hypothetical protein